MGYIYKQNTKDSKYKDKLMPQNDPFCDVTAQLLNALQDLPIVSEHLRKMKKGVIIKILIEKPSCSLSSHP